MTHMDKISTDRTGKTRPSKARRQKIAMPPSANDLYLEKVKELQQVEVIPLFRKFKELQKYLNLF